MRSLKDLEKTQIFAALIGLIVLSAGAAVYKNSNKETVDQKQLETLRIGYVPGALNSPHYTAIEEGFYRDAGFDAELVQMPGPEIGKAVVKGELDVGSSATTPAVYQRNADVPLTLVAARAGFQEGGKGAVLAVRKGSNIDSIEDFKGKTICTSTPGSMGDLWLRMWAEENNLTIGEDFKHTYLGDETKYVSAYSSGSVDACYLDTSMAITPLQQRGLAEPFYWMKNGQYVTAYVAVSNRMIEENPEKLKRFLRAYAKAAEYARNNPDERIENIAAYTKFSEETISQMPMPPIPTDLTIDVSDIREVQDLMYKHGQVDQKKNVGDMVNNRFIRNIQNDLES